MFTGFPDEVVRGIGKGYLFRGTGWIQLVEGVLSRIQDINDQLQKGDCRYEMKMGKKKEKQGSEALSLVTELSLKSRRLSKGSV